MSGELNPESCPHLGITRKKRNWQKKKKAEKEGSVSRKQAKSMFRTERQWSGTGKSWF